MELALVLFLVAALAFANGANDNGKAVATLVGFGAARPKEALLWATITTAAGAAFSFWFAGGILKSFSIGLFTESSALNSPFVIAVLAGACGWVLIATFTAMPVSTTHAIAGALTGAGLVAFGSSRFEWSFLGQRFALPLALSPTVSLALVYLASSIVLAGLGRIAGKCACVVEENGVVAGGSAAALETARTSVVFEDEEACQEMAPTVAVTSSVAVNALHWAASGAVGFARGWNDCPKIAALALVALSGASAMVTAFTIVTVAMALGGLLAGRRVLETLAHKLTPMPLAESLTASLTTAALVGAASWGSLPVSTTHVSTGAILGAGLRRDPKGVHWAKVGEIGLSWIVTLPAAALIAALVQFALR